MPSNLSVCSFSQLTRLNCICEEDGWPGRGGAGGGGGGGGTGIPFELTAIPP